MINPSNLTPDEELGRRVSSSKDSRMARRGNIPLRLFARRDTRELSVDRIREDWLPEVTAIAVNYDEGRNRNFYGWAIVAQDVASSNGRHIELSPQEDNEYHADIVLPDSVLSDKNELERHALELSAEARWLGHDS